MTKRILITGATDGIGLEAAKMMAADGYNLIIHGRNPQKIENTLALLKSINSNVDLDSVKADLSIMSEVKTMADYILNKYNHLDVLVNNAGIFAANNMKTEDNLLLHFAVNTIAPYYLSKRLLTIMDETGRIINLSSAAQAPVSLNIVKEYGNMSDNEGYAQSKLAITMWSFELATKTDTSVIAINPKSFLGSKMVKEAYGVQGHDIRIGGDIIYKASLSDVFENRSGQYFDNDQVRFANPHPDAFNIEKRQQLLRIMDEVLEEKLGGEK